MEFEIYGPNDKVVLTVSTIGFPVNSKKVTEKVKQSKLQEVNKPKSETPKR